MESKEALKEYEVLDGTPTWAIALFDKVSFLYSSIVSLKCIKHMNTHFCKKCFIRWETNNKAY